MTNSTGDFEFEYGVDSHDDHCEAGDQGESNRGVVHHQIARALTVLHG